MALSLFASTYGSDDPALLILHGFLGASGNWHTLARSAFAEHARVFALDARNHGRSPHSDAFSYADMTEDVRAFMDAQGLDRAILLGHSMGGKTAMHFALAHPERTLALVVVDIAPRAYPTHHDVILDALNSVDPAQFASRQEADAALEPHIGNWGVRQFLLKNLVARKGGGYDWAFNLPVLTARYEEITRAVPEAPPYPGPTLFIRGEKSDYVRDDDQPDIQERFPQAEIVTIPKAGHWVHAEAPDAVAEAVVSFLRLEGMVRQD